MIYREEDFLQLSGLQHFAFCRRQWALIHIEQQWRENLRTVEGDLLHRRAHDEQARERRGDILILRGLSVASAALGISGKCDVVEFRADPGGISLRGEEGLWVPFPVEYKRGSEGAIFYSETRRRTSVSFSRELREQVKAMLEEMHQLYRRGYTPKVRRSRSCNACSLKELCLPALMKENDVNAYLRQAMEVEP